jgi:hypothetical protein
MLRKCANPTCIVPFRSLREGKLFLAEAPLGEQDTALDKARKKTPKREHFWLCQSCSAHFTLHFDIDRGMMTVPLGRHSDPDWVPVLA